MKPHLALLVVGLLLAATAITNLKICLAEDSQLPEGVEFMEIVDININCTTASVSVTCGVISNNTELVRFPAEIDMNAAEWENVTQVMAGFSTANSFLSYLFNNTEEDNAEYLANILTNQLNTVFGTSFSHNSTSPSNGYVNVTYTGVGVGNLTDYTTWLMEECLASDLRGFSLTFIPMTNETGAYTLIGAMKESGGFDWIYAMGVMYHTTIPDGPGEHTIDVLDLLDVESLAPSPYSQVQQGITSIYMSMIIVTINSNETVAFVSCEPEQASPPARGWYIYPPIQPTQLQATFMFGDNPSPVTALSLTFSGVIIPEFTTPMLMAVLTFAATVATTLKRRFIRK
jgi:hypothetical protein